MNYHVDFSLYSMLYIYLVNSEFEKALFLAQVQTIEHI